jgi:ATP-dependent DNA helicase RecQ
MVDDTYRTGWTATVAAALLRDAGATAVLPIVVHRLP